MRGRNIAFAALVLAAGPAWAQDAADEAGEKKRNVVLLLKRQVFDGPASFPEFCAKNATKKRSALRVDVVARLRALADEDQPSLLEALGKPEGASRLWIVNAVVASLTEKEIEAAKALGQVKWVYPAGPVAPGGGDAGKVAEVLEPGKRAPFTTKGKTISWNVAETGAPKVWKDGFTGEGVVCASFDQGLNYRHSDLRGNIWINPDEVANNGEDDDGNGFVDDVYGFDFGRMKCELLDPTPRQHGTLTSCLVVGDGTGGTITGVAPRARLMALKGMGGFHSAARIFQYALDEGADVLSMSFSVPNLGDTRGLWRLMAEHATAAGMVLVSGAGNFGKASRQPAKIPVQIRIPEGIPCVICTGAINRKRKKVPPNFSQGPVEWESVRFYGDHPMPKGLIKPDVVAHAGPALALISSTENEGYLPEKNGRRGNSLTAPQIAGVCALILSAAPETTPWRVKALLEETAKDIKPKGKDPATGAGFVDAHAAVRKALGK